VIGARECRARVAGVRALTADVLEADLDMEDPPALAFEAGQWISVPLGPRAVRAYSIASTPLTPHRLTLCADVAPGGIGSRWFRALAPGDPVAFKAPLGGFVLAPADERRPLFVAEEIGIVPIRAILAWLGATGFARPATLVDWARDPAWLVYDAELRALARRVPAFAYHPVVGATGEHPAADWRHAGTAARAGAGPEAAPGPEELAEAVAHRVSDVAGAVAYVAGSGEAINRVRDVLMARGLERKAVRWEKFW
jgi:ferredoxin-NADP reductase